MSDIRGDFTGCSSKPFTHIHELKSSTRSNSGFIILLKDSLLSPRGSFSVWWKRSNQWPLDHWRDRYSARGTASLTPLSDQLITQFDHGNSSFFYSPTAPCNYEAQWRRNVCARVRARALNGVSCPWSVLFERVYEENILTLCLRVIWFTVIIIVFYNNDSSAPFKI